MWHVNDSDNDNDKDIARRKQAHSAIHLICHIAITSGSIERFQTIVAHAKPWSTGCYSLEWVLFHQCFLIRISLILRYRLSTMDFESVLWALITWSFSACRYICPLVSDSMSVPVGCRWFSFSISLFLYPSVSLSLSIYLSLSLSLSPSPSSLPPPSLSVPLFFIIVLYIVISFHLFLSLPPPSLSLSLSISLSLSVPLFLYRFIYRPIFPAISLLHAMLLLAASRYHLAI